VSRAEARVFGATQSGAAAVRVGEDHGCLENREDEGLTEKFVEKLAEKGKARKLIIR
jgi:hypothetical protein